jgi:hypothetical protein
MKKIVNYIGENIWTLAGTGLVLITLSGTTFRQAVVLTALAVAIHSVISLGIKDSE